MNRLAFLISLLLSAAALATSVLKVDIAPPFIAMAAWFAGLVGGKTCTRPIDFVAWCIAIILLFVIPDPVHFGLPWSAVAAGGMMVLFLFRNTFLGTVGLTRFIWVDLVATLAMLAGYILGNVLMPVGWIGWAAPALPVFYSVFKMLGGFIDYKQIKPLSEKKYKAVIGNPAPDFTLPDSSGKPVTLSDYKGKNSVLLVFVRGDWCPSCHITLRSYERNKEKLKEGNVVVIAIGPDPVGVNSEMVKRLGVNYHLLSDEKKECVKQYGIQSQDNNPMTKYEEGIPLPATFLVGPDGYIRYTSRADNPGEILNPNDIFPILEKIAS